MKINTQTLLQELKETTLQQQAWLNQLQSFSTYQLNWKASEEDWSLLECLEHLNRYGNFYLPTFESSIQQGKTSTKIDYRTGWLGNYFAKSMLPKNGQVRNKMKTFKDKNPSGSSLTTAVIDRHLAQQKRFLNILAQSEPLDFNKTKVPTTLGNWLKINYGDGLRFFANHITRHFLQLERVREKIND